MPILRQKKRENLRLEREEMRLFHLGKQTTAEFEWLAWRAIELHSGAA
jgi:hypothetical protein